MEIQVQYTAPVVTQLDQIGLSATLVLGANLLPVLYTYILYTFHRHTSDGGDISISFHSNLFLLIIMYLFLFW